MMGVKDIKEPPFYAPMEHFLINMNLHVTGGTMLIAPMHHPFIGNISFIISATNMSIFIEYVKTL